MLKPSPQPDGPNQWGPQEGIRTGGKRRPRGMTLNLRAPWAWTSHFPASRAGRKKCLSFLSLSVHGVGAPRLRRTRISTKRGKDTGSGERAGYTQRAAAQGPARPPPQDPRWTACRVATCVCLETLSLLSSEVPGAKPKALNGHKYRFSCGLNCPGRAVGIQPFGEYHLQWTAGTSGLLPASHQLLQTDLCLISGLQSPQTRNYASGPEQNTDSPVLTKRKLHRLCFWLKLLTRGQPTIHFHPA